MDPQNKQNNNTNGQSSPTNIPPVNPVQTPVSPIPPVANNASQSQPPPEYFQPDSKESPKSPLVTPEPIEQQAPQPSAEVGEPKKKSKVGVIVIVVIIILITIAALAYIFLNYMGASEEVVQKAAETEVMIPEPTITSSTDGDTRALGSQSSSDEVEAIETDITGTDLTNIDKEIDSITKEL